MRAPNDSCDVCQRSHVVLCLELLESPGYIEDRQIILYWTYNAEGDVSATLCLHCWDEHKMMRVCRTTLLLRGCDQEWTN